MESVDPRPPSGTEPASVETSAPRVGVPGSNGRNPEFASSPTADTPGHHKHTVAAPKSLPMTVFRLLAAVSFAGGFVLAGVHVFRVLDGKERSLNLSWGALAIFVVCLAGILSWTYCTVENASRIISPAETQELPSPARAVALWGVPLAFIVPATVVVVVLSRQWNDPDAESTSSIPLIVAFGAILISLLLLYAPLAALGGVVRKVGGQAGNLLHWAWVPAVFAVVGVAVVAGLRAFDVFEGEYDGLAPSWVIAVMLLLPIVVVFFVGHNAAYEMEGAVSRAFARRLGRPPAVDGHRPLMPHIYGAARPNRKVLSSRGPIGLFPGANAVRLMLVTVVAGVALLNIIGAIVMFLFWQESRDGLLLPSQRDRAWDVLIQLQQAERYVALVIVGVAVLWTLVNVYNVRLASGRRRNPLIAAASWPAAGAGLWVVGQQVTATSDTAEVIAVFLVQAAIAYVPFFFLERAATAIGARRSPVRIVWTLGLVMLVYVHGLGGLSTIGSVAEADRFGQIAGYLALGALVVLLSTLAITEACRAITDACEHEAEHHNFLLGQRNNDGPSPAPVRADAPQVATP